MHIKYYKEERIISLKILITAA